ncbi:MAG: peptidoglycan-binding protein, partial [Holosporales bacterium]
MLIYRVIRLLPVFGLVYATSAYGVDGGQAPTEYAKAMLKERLEKNPVAISAQHTALKKFYKSRDYQLAWTTSAGENAACSGALVAAIQNADTHGLEAEDYAALIARFEQTPASSQDPAQLMERDVALTEAALRYIGDLGGARLNPKSINKELFINPDPINADAALTKGASSQDCGWVEALAPQTKDYAALRSHLAELRAREKQNIPQSPLVLHKGETLEKGEQNERIDVLKARLVQEGYLSPEAAKIAAFDEATFEAVKRFQVEHGIEPDGVVGPSTAERLNQTIA